MDPKTSLFLLNWHFSIFHTERVVSIAWHSLWPWGWYSQPRWERSRVAVCLCNAQRGAEAFSLNSDFIIIPPYGFLLLLFSHSVMSDPRDCSTPGFPVLHYLPDFAQVHVHWVFIFTIVIICFSSKWCFCSCLPHHRQKISSSTFSPLME